MLTFIRSANDGSADVRMYRESATDCLPKKSMDRREFRELVVPHIVSAFGMVTDNNDDVDEDHSELEEMLSILREEVTPLLKGLVESKREKTAWSTVWRSLHRIKGGCQVVEVDTANEVVALIDGWKGEGYPPGWEMKVGHPLGQLELLLCINGSPPPLLRTLNG